LRVLWHGQGALRPDAGGLEIICENGAYVRNRTVGSPFTGLGLKDTGSAGTAQQSSAIELQPAHRATTKSNMTGARHA